MNGINAHIKPTKETGQLVECFTQFHRQSDQQTHLSTYAGYLPLRQNNKLTMLDIIYDLDY